MEYNSESIMEAFLDFNNKLIITRNFVASTYEECLENITKLSPNKEIEDEINKKISEFIKNKLDSISSFEEFNEYIDKIITESCEKRGIDHTKFATQLAKKFAENCKLALNFNMANYGDFINFYTTSQSIVLKNGLENIIIYFIEFLSQCFKLFFASHPGSMKNFQFAYSDISSCLSLDEIKNNLSSLITEQIMHKSKEEIFKEFFKHHSIESQYYEKHKAEILEIFYRRNIFVHNNGVVNKNYLGCSGNIFGFKEGQDAPIDIEYLYNSCSYLLLLSADIVTSIVSRLEKHNKKFDEKANKLSGIAFNCYLCQKDWKFAREFYSILITSKLISDDMRDMYQLNIWLCDKFSGKFKPSKKLISEWTKKRAFTCIGFSALIEDYDTMEKLIIENKYSPNDAIEIDSICTWPIFIEYREKQTLRFKNFCKKLKTC